MKDIVNYTLLITDALVKDIANFYQAMASGGECGGPTETTYYSIQPPRTRRSFGKCTISHLSGTTLVIYN